MAPSYQVQHNVDSVTSGKICLKPKNIMVKISGDFPRMTSRHKSSWINHDLTKALRPQLLAISRNFLAIKETDLHRKAPLAKLSRDPSSKLLRSSRPKQLKKKADGLVAPLFCEI